MSRDSFEELAAILQRQPLAVLSTRWGDQPYSNLVCFAASEDLSYISFATNRNTRKYLNLQTEPRVSFLIDNRSGAPDDIRRATATTALGVAREVNEEEKRPSGEAYLRKHPDLRTFVTDPETALFIVHIEKYITVTSLQSAPRVFTPPG
jgi:heme iron utilization protein